MTPVGNSAAGSVAPVLNDAWALFLDIDGTLLEIAPTPDSVVVPNSLVPTLKAVHMRLGGALAIVSGRPMSDIDRLLGPTEIPYVAEHGAIIRVGGGVLLDGDGASAVPPAWQAAITAAIRDWDGVIVEFKKFSVAIHYRKAPAREADLAALLGRIVPRDHPVFEVLRAHCGFEIRRRALNKGTAVQTLMSRAPFAGRLPVFVGDDVTDEDGFRVATGLGGFGLHVSSAFGGLPANVRRWLEAFVSSC
jgi:trehalose 6-phosphate phosphatase